MALKTYRTASGKPIIELLNEFGAKAAFSMGRQLYREATGIMEASRGLCPVDTGTLRASGYVAEPVQEGDVIRVELGYGGPAAKINPKSGESSDGYAIYVHENLDAHHPVGTAKFLELPLVQALKGMGGRIAAGMRRDLGAAGGGSE